jgi:hypothetical protein
MKTKSNFSYSRAWALVDSHQARDISDACSMLSRRRRVKAVPAKGKPAAPVVVMRLPYADN